MDLIDVIGSVSGSVSFGADIVVMLQGYSELLKRAKPYLPKEELKNFEEKEQSLTQQLDKLQNRFTHSNQAGQWLSKERERLANEAVNEVQAKHRDELRNFKVDKEALLLEINQYLYLIHEAAKLISPIIIDISFSKEEYSTPPLRHQIYVDAVDYVKLESEKILPSKQFKEIELYFSYLKAKLV